MAHLLRTMHIRTGSLKEDGIQRLKNVASGHYMAMNTDYAYIESVEAANVGSAAQWVIESNTGGTT